MIRIGMIGNGNISNQHKKAIAQIISEGGQVSLDVYCDANPATLKGLPGRTYTDVDTMLAAEQGKLDMVDICLPTFLHADVVVKALEHGMHVLCEKPMALNPEECDRMLEASQRTGKKLMIAHCNRFMSSVEIIRKTVESNELGKVRSAQFRRDSSMANTDSWFANGKISGGVAVDTHVHDTDLIRGIFGMPKAVSAAGHSTFVRDGYDAMSVNYMYDDGMFIHATANWTLKHNKFNSRTIRVDFEKGYLFCDRTPGRATFVKVTEDGTVTDLSAFLDSPFFYNELVYFFDCVANDKPVSKCPPHEAADAIRLVMAEIESADRDGIRITI